MRKFLAAVVLLAVVGGIVYFVAGRADGPAIEIVTPTRFVGLSTPLEVAVTAPEARVRSLVVTFEQNGTATTLFDYGPGSAAEITADPQATTTDADTLTVAREIGRASIPGLASGPGRLVVTASRPVLFGLREVETTVAHDVEVRLERPRLSVLSTHHYINVGGAEAIVYRVAPEDAASGVSVGGLEYPGYPAAGLEVDGVRIADPAVRVAFFALLWDQDPSTPMQLYARDEAGNTAEATFEHRVFPKPFKRSRIELNDAFIDRVVPAILEHTTWLAPQGSMIERYVAVNSELRRVNAEEIASHAASTSPSLLWRGVVFHPFTNSAVESAFADQRTYFYQGREVDRQVHLGFDLASYANTPIVAANRGTVLYADYLGIYGNCVILDHGMGLQSLYAHLSSIEVQSGQMVEKDQPLGRSGATGLAGGDHLHFTMLLNGRMVNPVEWWDAHWIEDRILRKLRDAQ